MLKKAIGLLSAVALLATISISASAKNPPLPENFTSLSIEDRMEWIDKNVQPDLNKLEQGLRRRNYEVTVTKRTKLEDGWVRIAEMETKVSWVIDGSGNIVEYHGDSITAYPAPDVYYTSGNDRIFGNMPNSTTAKLVMETRFAYIPAAQDYYYAHEYFVKGDGTYEFSVIQ